MHRNYEFKYGDGTVTVPLDPTQVIGELQGHDVPAIEDIPAAIRTVLEQPTASTPLRERVSAGQTVALVVSDMSRYWMRQDLVIPTLVGYLIEDCGVAATDITIVIANGTHIGGPEADLRMLVTDDVFDRIRVVNHDCEATDLVYLGTTSFGTPVELNRYVAEADCVVTLGACTHHVMAGYGGGRKSILPGIASQASIRANHAFSLDPKVLKSSERIGNGKLDDNPLHEDMVEAAGMVANLFVVNLVMNPDMQLACITAGHYYDSWLEGCDTVNRYYNVDVPCQADVIVTSCGGYPKDMSLYQGTKTIDNVESGLKLGGTLILLIEAREGGGAPEYFDWITNLQDGSIEDRLRNAFTIPGYIFFLNCEQAQRYRVMLYTSVAPEIVAPMGLEAYNDIDALLAAADLEGKSIYVIPNGSTVIPHCVQE